MSRILPLIFKSYDPEPDISLQAETIYREYTDLLALPSLKEKLEYFNTNICSLALEGKYVEYNKGPEKIKIYHAYPCVCGFSTEEDKKVFELIRDKELERLTTELGKYSTYKEKLSYLITQPGFNLERVIIIDDLDAAPIIDLSPDGSSAERMAAFNDVSKADFEKNYFPKQYRNLLLSKEKELIDAQLKEAMNPNYDLKSYIKQIENYTGYNPSDESGQSLLEARERINPKKPDLGLVESWKWERAQRIAVGENDEYNRKAKGIFLDLVSNTNVTFDLVTSDLAQKPFYHRDWEPLEHGRQIYLLYKWLSSWKLEEAALKTGYAVQNFKAPIYALYHWLMIEMGREERFELNEKDQLPAATIMARALELYPGKVGKGGQTFYRAFTGIAPEKKRVWEKLIALNKPKLIIISGNDPDVIQYLESYPD